MNRDVPVFPPCYYAVRPEMVVLAVITEVISRVTTVVSLHVRHGVGSSQTL